MEIDEKKYLYLLLLIPLLLAFFVYNMYWKRRKQREFGDLELVKRLLPELSVLKQCLKFVLMLLVLAFLTLGLANPKVGTKSATVKREGIDIVFAVDVSKSMLCEDIAPSRLGKSKQIVSQLINQLGGDRIGIVAYAGSAFPVLPITGDYSVAKMYLQGINPEIVSSQGTSLDEALELSSSLFDENSKTSKLIILISDGEDHSSGAETAADEAKDDGIKIITVGIGTEKGGPIPLKRNGVVQRFQRDEENAVVITKRNTESLEAIANASQGYVNGNNTREAVNFVRKRLASIEKTEFETQEFTDYNSQFQWFLGFAFVLLVSEFFLTERKSKWLEKLNLFNERKQ
ncbi:MAG TPA: VWA domain-containing protein [Flavobacterium sp.]|jgi:Ca-activated chloride channel family protein